MPDALRPDHRCIYDLVSAGSKVLDLGCGTGELLAALAAGKGVEGHGIELDEQAIYAAVARGLSVMHGDIDSGLADYPDRSFDFVILDHSLQEVRHVDRVMDEALRIGRRVIVGFPNFAHWRARVQIFFGGRTPVTPGLPHHWHDTPNLHFLTLRDFHDYCRRRKIRVHAVCALGERGPITLLPGLRAESAIFVLSAG